MNKEIIKRYELIIRIVNFIFLIPVAAFLCYGMLALVLSFACAMGGMACVESINNNSDSLFSQILSGNGLQIMLLLLGAFIIINLIFNICMIVLLRKLNKESNIKEGYGIRRHEYLLLWYFLGFLGIHKFVTKNNKAGFANLIILIGIPLVISLINSAFTSIVMIVSILIVGCINYSDLIICISKVIDENKLIYF